MIFEAEFCDRCIHDAEQKCEIHDRALLYDTEDAEYPREWRYDEEGNPTCTAFATEILPPSRTELAFRSPYPESLATADDPVGKENDAWLIRMRDISAMVLGAWGVKGDFNIQRTSAVLTMFPELYHLGLTTTGHPKHPLYIPKIQKPRLMSSEQVSLLSHA